MWFCSGILTISGVIAFSLQRGLWLFSGNGATFAREQLLQADSAVLTFIQLRHGKYTVGSRAF